MDEKQFDVISLGRLGIDLYANEIGAELANVKSFNVYAGGCPTNVAVGTRRLG
ncbi:MAG: 5-dehydro-2-deoxygluconokinase, partial [Chitinophagaceae bacterium]|nr:5-dehydro-2-deoxygluconokinase [Anaerolineae bacterium]